MTAGSASRADLGLCDLPERGDTSRAEVGALAYALVHLVAHESFEELIEAQVVNPMIEQARLDGPLRPKRVIIGFLEPARVALTGRHRRRMRTLRRRSSSVATVVLPFVSRLGIPLNSRMLALRLQRLCGGLPMLLHCRGESAAIWGSAIARHVPGAAVISDIRGIWPDEMILARGYRKPADADPQTRRAYDEALAHLRNALAGADGVFAVSGALVQWLARLGVSSERVLRVPCCVAAISYTEATRTAHRAALGISDQTVLAYLGGVASYQHLEEGLVPFARLALAVDDRVHLLCITNDPLALRRVLRAGGVGDSERVTVMRLPQEEVASVLTAADAGFLLREANEVNRVAMPVKVAEYLSSGVPLIASRVFGAVDELIETYGAGVLVTWFGRTEQERAEEVKRIVRTVRERGADLREGALQLCRDNLLWSTHFPVVREAYVRALHTARARRGGHHRSPSSDAWLGE